MRSKKDVWIRTYANNLVHLAQGVGTQMLTGTNTVFFVPLLMFPRDLKVTYGRLVATLCPQKEEFNRFCITVTGNKLEYLKVTSMHCDSPITTKCILISTLSTPRSKFLVLDIINFYYNNPMGRYKYINLPLHSIPDKIIAQYNLCAFALDGWVYLKTRKGMSSLMQSGIISNDRLTLHLAKRGYSPVPRTLSLWAHAHLTITFSLVVDNFGVKYTGNSVTHHLITSLLSLYTISVDWSVSLFYGLTLTWDYSNPDC